MLDKRKFKEALIVHLQSRVDLAQRSSRSAAADSKEVRNCRRAKDEGDDPSDAYLAAGQAARFRGLRDQLETLEKLTLRDFGDDDAVGLGALVDIEDEDGLGRTVFVLNAGAGVELEVDDALVTVVTPSSPIGKAMKGKRLGDEFELHLPGDAKEYEIVAIQ